jgi:hypothetical protein
MGRQYWVDLLANATQDGTAVANTTTETIVYRDVVMPANYNQDGRLLRLTVYGKLSTTGTPTITLAIRWGGVSGTLLATTEAITCGSGVTNVNWSIDALIQVRSNGSAGTLMVMGNAVIHTSATTVAQNVFGVSGHDAPAPVTVNLEADTSLSITADWSAASSSNTLTGLMYLLEAVN